VAVVDYGMGNVFSVMHALKHVGLDAVLSREPDDLARAHGIVIPGVGAMPDAMQTLRTQGLVDCLISQGQAGKPILGICLGFQLLMDTGTEFGTHAGLGLIPGQVLPLPEEHDIDGHSLPVPNVRWSPLSLVPQNDLSPHPFDNLSRGDELYFVHSYYVSPTDKSILVAKTHFGEFSYCAAARVGNVYGCQFHPERSGEIGLTVFHRFATILADSQLS
jgi:glutamine amidotransferase